MNIKQLKELIANLPDNTEVILQKDREGNGYSPLQLVDTEAIYIPKNTWSGVVLDANWTHEQAGLTKDEWDHTKSFMGRVLVLVPVN